MFYPGSEMVLTPGQKLTRFCHIGSFHPVYKYRHTGINIEKNLPILEEIFQTIEFIPLIMAIKDGMQMRPYPRYEAPLIALAAFYTCERSKDVLRSNVVRVFPSLIENDEQLFQFLSIVQRIQTIKERKTFSKTVEKAVQLWYEKQSLDRILYMWQRDLAAFSFNHTVVMKLFHIDQRAVWDNENTLYRYYMLRKVMEENKVEKKKPSRKSKKASKDSAEKKTETSAESGIKEDSKTTAKEKEGSNVTEVEMKDVSEKSNKIKAESKPSLEAEMKEKSDLTAEIEMKDESDTPVTDEKEEKSDATMESEVTEQSEKDEKSEPSTEIEMKDDSKAPKKAKKKENSVKNDKKDDLKASKKSKKKGQVEPAREGKSEVEKMDNSKDAKKGKNMIRPKVSKEAEKKTKSDIPGEKKMKRDLKPSAEKKTRVPSHSASNNGLATPLIVAKETKQKKILSSVEPDVLFEDIQKLRNPQIQIADAIKIIRKYKLTFEQVPLAINKWASVVKEVIHSMSYVDLLNVYKSFFRYKYYRNAQLKKIFSNRITDMELFSKSCLAPVNLLISMDKLESKLRFKDNLFHVVSLKQLANLVCGKDKSKNYSVCIVLNLQEFYKDKKLRNHNSLKYFNTLMALAFGLFRRQERVQVLRWYEDPHDVMRLPWTKDMTLEEAETYTNTVVQNKYNSQNLRAPINYAMRKKESFDLFLCIGPKFGRSNPNNKSDALHEKLNEYRKRINPNAKMVLVSLMQYNKWSMLFNDDRNEHILEILGVDEYTVQLIDAYAMGRFY